ncbi:MAG: type II toxin-antitoxin system HicB family antitoxin [Methylovulum sp.]|jgi:predicted RNase H-like HicB family nuclease|nr:type II toxin-antitoxin system HicB family antitoxin [Methylovulum sp.]
MLYPVYVHLGDATHAHGVTIPDFPGCFSAADDWQDLPRMVQEAVELWCEGQAVALPTPTPLDDLVKHPDYIGGVWLLVTIDTATLETKPVRLNISLPQGLVSEIDGYAKAHGATRSGFLAQAARQAMRQAD